jgi:hypothetical protein
MTKILKTLYSEKLVDYFYDNVWVSRSDSVDPFVDFDDWVYREYNAQTSRWDPYIRFDREEDATLFILRWQ